MSPDLFRTIKSSRRLSEKLGSLLLSLSVLAAMGCAHTTTPRVQDDTISELFALGVPAALARSEAPRYQIDVFSSGPKARLSLHCVEAPIHDVLVELLSRCEVDYRVGSLRLHGLASIKLTNCSLIEAVQALLRQCEASAFWDRTSAVPVLCIENRPLKEPVFAAASNSGDSSLVTKRLQLKHRSASAIAQNLLGASSAPFGVWRGTGKVAIAVHPETNYLYLRGDVTDVERTLQLVRAADREAPVIKVELFVLDRKPQSTTEIQSPQWTVGVDDSFLTWIPGRPTDGGVGYSLGFHQSPGAPLNANYLSSFRLQSSHQLAQGRLLNHTELMVQTGQPMSLIVGKTGYTIKSTLSSGVPSGQQQVVNATTQFTITPKALPGGQIQLAIDQSNARFTPSQLSANVSQRSIKGTLTIPNGGFVMLGGQNFRLQQMIVNQPLWLRHLPLISSLFSQLNETDIDDTVVTLVKASLVEEDSLSSPSLFMPAIPACDLPTGLMNVPD